MQPVDAANTSGTEMKPVKSSFSKLPRLWIAVFLVLLLLVFSLRFFGFRVEDVQSVLFPFVVLSLWLLFRKSAWRIPGSLVLLILLFWFVGASQVRAYWSAFGSEPNVVLARMSDDENGYSARGFLRRYEEMVGLYAVPEMGLLQRSFLSVNDAKKWLKTHSGVHLLLKGTASWLEIIVTDSFSFFHTSASSGDKLPQYFNAELRKAGLRLDEGISVLKRGGLEEPFVVVEVPEKVSLPVTPPDLSRHYLAWLSQVFLDRAEIETRSAVFSDLAEGSSPEAEAAQYAFRESYLWQALKVDGQWRTLEPRGASYFFKGVLSMAESVQDEETALKPLRCALESFKRSLEYLPVGDSPELYAAAYNNAAVVQLFRATKQKDFYRAYDWLLKASSVTDENGQAVRGSRAALVNLMMFWRSGVY